jgi:RNA polymerase sigma factor (sigma-70 family)
MGQTILRVGNVKSEEVLEAVRDALDEIGADESADNVLLIGDLLRPTFEQRRPDRRVDWWRMEPEDARDWLRRRLRDRRFEGCKDEDRRKSYEDRYDEEDRSIVRVSPSELAAELEFLQEERMASLHRDLRSMLSERQYQVLLLLAEGCKYERIAKELGIGLNTVKTHVLRIRRNHELTKDPDLLRALLL